MRVKLGSMYADESETPPQRAARPLPGVQSGANPPRADMIGPPPRGDGPMSANEVTVAGQVHRRSGLADKCGCLEEHGQADLVEQWSLSGSGAAVIDDVDG